MEKISSLKTKVQNYKLALRKKKLKNQFKIRRIVNKIDKRDDIFTHKIEKKLKELKNENEICDFFKSLRIDFLECENNLYFLEILIKKDFLQISLENLKEYNKKKKLKNRENINSEKKIFSEKNFNVEKENIFDKNFEFEKGKFEFEKVINCYLEIYCSVVFFEKDNDFFFDLKNFEEIFLVFRDLENLEILNCFLFFFGNLLMKANFFDKNNFLQNFKFSFSKEINSKILFFFDKEKKNSNLFFEGFLFYFYSFYKNNLFNFDISENNLLIDFMIFILKENKKDYVLETLKLLLILIKKNNFIKNDNNDLNQKNEHYEFIEKNYFNEFHYLIIPYLNSLNNDFQKITLKILSTILSKKQINFEEKIYSFFENEKFLENFFLTIQKNLDYKINPNETLLIIENLLSYKNFYFKKEFENFKIIELLTEMTFEKSSYLKIILNILESFLFEIDQNDIFDNLNFYLAFSKNIIDIICDDQNFEILEYCFSILEMLINFVVEIDVEYRKVFLKIFKKNTDFNNLIGDLKDGENKPIKDYLKFIAEYLNINI